MDQGRPDSPGQTRERAGQPAAESAGAQRRGEPEGHQSRAALPRVLGNRGFGAMVGDAAGPRPRHPGPSSNPGPSPNGTRPHIEGQASPAAAAPGFAVEATGSPAEREARATARAAVSAPPTPPEGPGRADPPPRPQPGWAPARAVPPDDAALVQRALLAGHPLPPDLRTRLESHVAGDLGEVRVHRGAAASAATSRLGTRAFTVGQDIVLGAAAPHPSTAPGLHLLLHEATHTLQPSQVGGLRRIRREDRPDAISDGTATPPVADEEPDPGLDIRRAARRNRAWWAELELAEVRPLGDIRPDEVPATFANRVLGIQQASHVAHLRQFTIDRDLTADGILGPRTLWFLWALANATVAEGDLAPLRALGVDLAALAGAAHSVAIALAIIRRPRVAARWTFTVPADQVLRYYRGNYGLNRNDADLLDQVLFDGPAPSDVTRDDRHELLALLFGGQDFPGIGALVTVDRSYLHKIDSDFVVHRGPRRAGRWAPYFAFRISTESAADEAVSALGLSVPGTPRARRVRQRLGEGGPPTAGLLVAIDIPALDPAQRDAVVAQYLAQQRMARAEREREVEEHNRMAARQRADRFLELADHRRDLRFTVDLQRLVRDLARNPAVFFEYFLDDLRGREPEQFTAFFDAVEGVRTFSVHAPVIRLALGTRYAADERVRQSLTVLNARRQGVMRSQYESGGVRLGGSDGPLLGVGQVAGDLHGAYLRDESLDRIKPARMAQLAEVAKDKAAAIFGEILAGRDSRSLTQEQVATEAFEQAAQEIGLNEDDVESDVDYEESVRLTSIRQATVDGIERSYLTWEVVERWGGSGDWTPVPDAEESGDDMAFDFRLSLYRLSQTADVVQGAAMGLLIVGAIAVAWEAGLVGLLLRAAGGAGMVGGAIVISELVYVATSYWSDEPLTLKGFLFAALDGYLGALAFHRFAPLGSIISRRFVSGGTTTMRQLVVAWLLSRGTVGALSGAASMPASMFARELVEVLSGDRSRFSSLGAYLTQAGYGALFGAAFEIAGSGLLSLFRGQGSSALARAADVAARIRDRGINPGTWLAESAGVLSRFRIWLAANLHDDLAAAVSRELRTRLEAVGAALSQGGRTARARWRVEVMRQLLDLADRELSRDATAGMERMLLAGQAGGHALSDDAAIGILRQLRAAPERIDPFLALMKDIQTPVLDDLLARGALGRLADAGRLLSISPQLTAANTGALLVDRFAMSITDFDTFAGQLTQIDHALGAARWPGIYDGALLHRLLGRVDPATLLHIYDNSADVAASAAFIDTIAPTAVAQLNRLANQQLRELFTRDPRIIRSIAASAEAQQVNVLRYIERIDEVFRPATPGAAARAGHAATGHGPHIPDDAMFARAALEGHDISRWSSVQALDDALEQARLAMIDDAHALATRGTDFCPINAQGWARVDAGTRTVAEILTDPAYRRFLKRRVQYEGNQPGAGSSFDPDGVTIRPADDFLVVLALDDAGHYRVITGFPQR